MDYSRHYIVIPIEGEIVGTDGTMEADDEKLVIRCMSEVAPYC